MFAVYVQVVDTDNVFFVLLYLYNQCDIAILLLSSSISRARED